MLSLYPGVLDHQIDPMSRASPFVRPVSVGFASRQRLASFHQRWADHAESRRVDEAPPSKSTSLQAEKLDRETATTGS